VWYSLLWVWGSEFVLCVGVLGVCVKGERLCTLLGRIWSGFGGMSVC